MCPAKKRKPIQRSQRPLLLSIDESVTLLDLGELVDAVNSSAIGVCLDVERIGALGSPLDWIHTLRHRVKAVRYTEVPCSAGSVAQTSQTPIDLLFQTLDENALDCPLILSGSAAKGRFAGWRCNG